ncbi:MAG: hypothetical protein ACREM3_25500 [Candidatus Rokuibacteriota bacterium]
MDEQKVQEATRRPQEGARRQERAAETGAEAARVASQLTEFGAQTIGLWAEVNQKVVRDLMEVSTSTMREGARLVMDLQSTQLDAAREMQGAAWRWWLTWPQACSDPMRWYQQIGEEGVDGLKRLVRLGRRSMEGIGQTVDRLEGSAEETARSLDGTFKEATSRMRDIQSRSERLRVA